MKTQLEVAREGSLSEAMRAAALRDQAAPDLVRAELAAGRAVLPVNPAHTALRPVAIGRAFRTKVNANLGRSPGQSDTPNELCKLRVALSLGVDTVMDLSVGDQLAQVRKALLAECPAPLGTVPIYEAVSRTGVEPEGFDPGVLMEVIAEQAGQGVDFMTLHAGVLAGHIGLAMKRRAGIVSRGGAILAHWMAAQGRENPLYERWDDVLEICQAHDVTVSLGDGLRPGCLADAGDAAQFAELDVLGELVQRCRRAGVQVMVEGPGHVPFHQIPAQVERAARVCDGAPFYVLGPVVTDVAPGYDHITSCIGATAAAAAGAALLCYVTPAEHLGLPTVAEVREGVVAYRIAAHAADVAKGLPGARDWDDAMTRARVAFDWERQFDLALDGERARRRFREAGAGARRDPDGCTMCGASFCAMRLSKKIAERVKGIPGGEAQLD